MPTMTGHLYQRWSVRGTEGFGVRETDLQYAFVIHLFHVETVVGEKVVRVAIEAMLLGGGCVRSCRERSEKPL